MLKCAQRGLHFRQYYRAHYCEQRARGLGTAMSWHELMKGNPTLTKCLMEGTTCLAYVMSPLQLHLETAESAAQL